MPYLDLLRGKKTYLTVLVGIGFGIAQGLGIPIPPYVDWILVFLGLGFHRSALSDHAAQIAMIAKMLIPEVQEVLVQPTNQQTSEQKMTEQLNKKQL